MNEEQIESVVSQLKNWMTETEKLMIGRGHGDTCSCDICCRWKHFNLAFRSLENAVDTFDPIRFERLEESFASEAPEAYDSEGVANYLSIRQRDAGTIYAVHAVGTNRYKFGLTRSGMNGRMNGLSTGSPFDLRLLKSVSVDGVTNAEFSIHNHLKEYRKKGEWFELSDEQLIDAIRHMETFTVSEPKNSQPSAMVR